MNDSFGGQNGMEGIVGAGKDMREASKGFHHGNDMFKTSVGKWSFGVFMVKDVFGKFIKDFRESSGNNSRNLKQDMKQAVKEMGGVLTEFVKAFSKAKWIDVIADMINSVYGVRKELERTYGAFGEAGNTFTNGILEQTKKTNEFGARWEENIKSFSAIADKLGTMSFDMNMVGNNSLFSKAFDISEEMAANISTSFKFAGASAKQTYDFMDGINKGATAIGLSPSLVAQNVAASEKSMMRFAVSTERGSAKLKQMALISSKMGVGIDNMVGAMDQFRTVGGAMEGSAQLSLLGMNTNAMQLLSGARGADPSKFFEQAMGHLSKFADSKTGQLNPVGYDIANALAPMLNMSFEEIQKAMYRSKQEGGTPEMLKHYATMKERADKMQTMTEQVSNTMYKILDFLTPVINKLTQLIDILLSHKTSLMAIIIGLTLLQIAVAVGFKNLLIRMMGKGVSAGVTDALDGMGGGSNPAPVSNLSAKQMKAQGILNTTQTGMLRAESAKIAAQAKMVAASAVPMLAFAGSMIMLAKAFQMFGTVEWKGVKTGLAAMGAMVASLAVLAIAAKFAAIGATVMYAIGGAFLLIGVATIAAAYGFSLFSKSIVPLLGQGMALVKLSGGLLALTAAMIALGAASAAMPLVALGAVFSGILGIGVGWVGGKVISSIGESAIKYSDPITRLATGLTNLADALSRIQNISIKPIDFDAIKKLSDVASNYPKLIGATSGGFDTPIEITVHSTLVLEDGSKLAEHISQKYREVVRFGG